MLSCVSLISGLAITTFIIKSFDCSAVYTAPTFAAVKTVSNSNSIYPLFKKVGGTGNPILFTCEGGDNAESYNLSNTGY